MLSGSEAVEVELPETVEEQALVSITAAAAAVNARKPAARYVWKLRLSSITAPGWVVGVCSWA
jgi:hypothetical protein